MPNPLLYRHVLSPASSRNVWRLLRTLVFALELAVGGASLAFAQNSPAPTITLAQATAMALKNHPQIAASQNLEYAANQRVIEQRAAYYPAIFGEITGSQGSDNSRLGAGDLSASRLFTREGDGLQINQLVTDFGRTKNLVSSSALQAQAASQATLATRYGVLLGVNQAYYAVLQAQAFIRVANETINARQTVADQVSALAKAQLKSQLDVSFAQVNLSEARLLLIRSQDTLKRAYADLSRSLGEDQQTDYQLVDDVTTPGAPPSPDTLIDQAIRDRPELAQYRLQLEAARRFEQAERDLLRPVVSAIAVGGALPYIDTAGGAPVPKEYDGIGVNVSIPIFTGHLYQARRSEAHFQTLAQTEQLRSLRQQVERDVRASWAATATAYQRIPVSEELVKQARLGFDLSQGRYKLGLASIVEVTQAQLNLTQAEIENVSAIYDYKNTYAALQYTIGALR
jgi:outer membrane protein